MNVPAITVLMPVYNAERFVAQAVESVLRQSQRDFEFIIIDDGSSDGSLEILKRFAAADARIVLRSRANTGLSVALNEGLALARGHYLARMDADDICRETRFERQFEFLERHPECVIVGSFIARMDQEGWPISVLTRPTSHAAIEAMLLNGIGGAVIHPSAMIRANALRRIGGYRPEWEPAEDFDLYFRLAEIGELANIPEVLLDYRFNMGGVSCTRMGVQTAKGHRLLAEARQRRKLPVLHVRQTGGSFSRFRYESSIVYRSLLSGHHATTRKHVITLIRWLWTRLWTSR